MKILDVGTGSGCIIISLAKVLDPNPSPGAIAPPSPVGRGKLRSSLLPLGEGGRRPDEGFKFFASDISKAALKVARKNAKLHKTRILFKQSDLLAGWKNEHFDVIVANLPYLAKQTDPSTKFEPKQALIAKKQGLALIEKLSKQISTLTPHPSTVFLEFDPRQTSKIKNLVKKYLSDYKAKTYKDLAGKNRYAVIERQFV